MTKINMCKIIGCRKPIISRGWCSMHYSRWWKRGDPLISKKPGDPKLVEADVIAIRADSRPIQQIADDYNIDQSNVSLIKNRKRWAHVK